MSTGVLLALPGEQESDLVQALDAPGTGVRVVRRCADVPEVLAAALAGLGTVAVLSADLPGVDRTVLVRAQQAGVRTVLVAEDADAERCRALGADAVVTAGTPTADLASVTVALAHDPAGAAGVDDPPETAGTRPSARAGTDPSPGPGGDPTAGAGTDPSTGPGPSREAPTPEAEVIAAAEQVLAEVGGERAATGVPDDGAEPDRETAERGQLIAVWGPYGAPGRTTVAVNLAAELAARHHRALLVDADTEAPAITQTLGLLEESSGIAAAARLAAHGRLDRATLSRLCPRLDADGGLRVLTGLTRPDRWRELPAAALDVVWEHARALAPWTVVDLAAGAEDDATGFGPAPQRRHQATLSALAAADVVVVVGAAEPVGMRRLVLALGELRERRLCHPEARRVVVVTRVRAAAVGPAPHRAVRDTLARYGGVEDAVLVADDRPAADRALLAGATLMQTAPASPARDGYLQLTDRVAGISTRRRRRPRPGGLRRRAR
ncbi:hypothetical protein PU560_06290 [Georgenia sp. 10Sc9-8]|uniref:CobQ/CobB/MinD/ParA nucleotide binding domain-containing protein n=1 Tax=Georgenia halotolerans TaxID=3028317 RepID=A0ABT5TY56_9MICO|nr:hypothetical protein [Georgenia halotolerans]